jgi:hypothetical protein
MEAIPGALLEGKLIKSTILMFDKPLVRKDAEMGIIGDRRGSSVVPWGQLGENFFVGDWGIAARRRRGPKLNLA